jgi:YfiH family protein
MSGEDEWLVPDWPAPRGVRAFVTTRAGGVSSGEYASMNLGKSSGDDPASVERNRAIVRARLPEAPRWMAQVHGTAVADLDGIAEDSIPTADAATTGIPGRVGAVLTADCMPLFFCHETAGRVGVAHAGWRGLSAGVIEDTVRAIGAPPRQVMAWMGPAIGPDAFEVGPEVRAAFLAHDAGAAAAFTRHREGKYMADLYALARRRLALIGVERVFGGSFCTYHETSRFFSYRREKKSGRMGAFIWVE